MYVTLLMDVEDLVDPEADDIAGVCSDILTEEGVEATLCLVGWKVRLLQDRGREDVIKKLSRHDIGFHTDTHSVHPTISEYLAPLTLEVGVSEVLRREAPGVNAIAQAFGKTPSCFGGPGNTWGPAVCEAMRRLGVPAFVYAHTAAPSGSVHRFGGLIAYPNGPSLSDGCYQDDQASRERLDGLKVRLTQEASSGALWQQAFIGHPTRILHECFWDDPLFYRGANPPQEMWQSSPRKSDADLERALKNFRSAIQEIRDLPGVELKTIRVMNTILERHQPTSVSGEAAERLWPSIEHRLKGMAGWPIIPEGTDYTNICAQTHELLSTLEDYA